MVHTLVVTCGTFASLLSCWWPLQPPRLLIGFEKIRELMEAQGLVQMFEQQMQAGKEQSRNAADDIAGKILGAFSYGDFSCPRCGALSGRQYPRS